MFAIFSSIENIPNIHQIHTSESSARDSLKEIVMKNTTSLTIPLNEIKLDSFQQYPSHTYLIVDDKNIDIYRHQIVDKVQKGWMWNGMKKDVESTKIGSYQILSVSDPIPVIEKEKRVEMETESQETNSLMVEIEKLIDEVINEISNANHDLNKDIEDVKHLESDIRRHLNKPVLLDYNTSSIDIPYLKIEYPEQPTTTTSGSNIETYDKKQMLKWEREYLPFLDEDTKDERRNKSETEDDISEDQRPSEVRNQDTKDEDTKDEGTNIQRCRSSRRGTHSCRSNYHNRKMRLRAY